MKFSELQRQQFDDESNWNCSSGNEFWFTSVVT